MNRGDDVRISLFCLPGNDTVEAEDAGEAKGVTGNAGACKTAQCQSEQISRLAKADKAKPGRGRSCRPPTFQPTASRALAAE